MNYCQFRNDFIKRMANVGGGGLLPAEYQQVEYLAVPYAAESPYISTSVPLTSTYYIEVRYKMGYPSGSMFGSVTTRYPFGDYNPGIGRMILSVNKDALITKDTNTHTIIAYYDEQTTSYRAFLDGTETNYASDQGNTANNGFSLFRSNYGGDKSVVGSIYYAKIKESINGNTTLDMLPCYRKSDNKPGMYDLVTNTFFTNAGTGEFTVGPDV